MITMNIRKHISHRRHSERVMSMRHKRLLSLEMSRKNSLQDMATRNIDKQMENIQKELFEMRNPSRSRGRKKQYKFPVPSPVWKRRPPPQETHSNNPHRRDVSLLESFDDNENDNDEDCIEPIDSYQQWSTSETVSFFNKDDNNENGSVFNLKNSQPVPPEESASSLMADGIFINPSLVSSSRQDNKTSSLTASEQTENPTGLLSPEPLYQSNVTEKPLVIFSPEKTSSFAGQFVHWNNASKNAKEMGSLQPVAEEIPQPVTLLQLPPVRYDGVVPPVRHLPGAAAAVIESPEQSPSPTRPLGIQSTAADDVRRASLPVAITQEGQHQQPNSDLQNNWIVGDGGFGGKIQSHYHSYSTTETNPNNSKQQDPIFAVGVPDFATLARTSMSSIKKDIARRLSTTAAPTELKKLQWQRNSGAVPKNRFQRLLINPESSSSENTIPGSRTNQLLVSKQEGNDKRRKSEGGEFLGTTASLRRLSLYTPKEEPTPRQEALATGVTSNSPESDTGLRVNKPKAEEKHRRKSYLKSYPVYDREYYNPDGSLRTVYCLPSFKDCWEQAQRARYIRTREVLDRDKELSVDEVFAKYKDDTSVEDSGMEK